MVRIIFLILFISWTQLSCNSVKEDNRSPDIIYLKPIKTITAFGDSLYFKSITDIEVINDTLYFSLFNENTVIQTNTEFEVKGVLKSTGKGPGEFSYPTQLATNQEYLVINDDGNKRFNLYDHKLKNQKDLHYEGFLFSDFMITPNDEIVYSPAQNFSKLTKIDIRTANRSDLDTLQLPPLSKTLNFRNNNINHLVLNGESYYVIGRSFPILEERNLSNDKMIKVADFTSFPIFQKYFKNLRTGLKKFPRLVRNSIDLISDVCSNGQYLYLLCYEIPDEQTKDFIDRSCTMIVRIDKNTQDIDKIFQLSTEKHQIYNAIAIFENYLLAAPRNQAELHVFEWPQ